MSPSLLEPSPSPEAGEEDRLCCWDIPKLSVALIEVRASSGRQARRRQGER